MMNQTQQPLAVASLGSYDAMGRPIGTPNWNQALPGGFRPMFAAQQPAAPSGTAGTTAGSGQGNMISYTDVAQSGGPALAQPDMQNRLPAQMISQPTSVAQNYSGSLKALLARNIGVYVVATFLVGTQSSVNWEGVLYEVGNDYIILYQAGRDRYVMGDLYSLKFVEFYDTENDRPVETPQ